MLSWLPVTLEKSDQSKHTILSTAVRAGYIILWSFDVPIDELVKLAKPVLNTCFIVTSNLQLLILVNYQLKDGHAP